MTMSKLFLIAVSIFISTAFAKQQIKMKRIATCTAPLIVEGELIVYLSADKKLAKVSLSNMFDYPTKIVSVSGPVMAFDYNTRFSLERIIIAVDGGHELHSLDQTTNQFKKIANLNCTTEFVD